MQSGNANVVTTPPPSCPRAGRRTEGCRVRGRSARVVDHVLRATVEELGRVGYAALRVEDVAAASKVNKTTVYRRWPTKIDLVAAALQETVRFPLPPDTGDVREDLLESLREGLAFACSPTGRGIIRILQAERAHPEVEAISRSLRAQHRQQRRTILERAVERGQLPPRLNADLIVEILHATLYSRVIAQQEIIDEGFFTDVVDLLLAGALAQAAKTT